MTIAQRNRGSRNRCPHAVRRRAAVLVSDPEGEG